jgi:hypothetical protein
MKPEHNNKGFHRVGVVLAGACLVPASIFLAASAYGYATHNENLFSFFTLGVPLAMVAAVAYGLARRVGWIVDGFS